MGFLFTVHATFKEKREMSAELKRDK